MGEIFIREYQESDREKLQELLEKLMDFVVSTDPLKRIRRMPDYGPMSLERTLKKIFGNNGVIYFAVDGEKIVGMIGGFITQQTQENLLEVIPNKLAVIEDLFVEQEYRGKHIGRILMEKLEQYFKDQGCDSVWIEVFAPNEYAHNYYKEFGFIDREYGLLKRLS